MSVEKIEESNKKMKRNDEFFALRHGPMLSEAGKPRYRLNDGIIESQDPEAAPDAEKQWFYSDLTAKSKEFVRQKATEFFEAKDPETGELLINPETDALFFVSSDLVRATETAKLFLDEAKKRGFEIIKPRSDEVTYKDYREKRVPRNRDFRNKAEEIGQGDIRKIDCLTLNHLKNMLHEQVFQPVDFLKEVVNYPSAVSEETKEKWKQARAIIEADNREHWGANYAVHADAIAKIFPDVKTAKQVYESKFKNMVRLAKFANRKIKEHNPEKNVKVLGFSHENSFLHFMRENFNSTMGYCESVGFKVVEEGDAPPKVLITAKGKTIEFKD